MMRRSFLLIAVATAVQVVMAMPLGGRLAAWSVFTPDMVMVEVTGGDRVSVPAGWLSAWPEILSSAGGDLTAALRSTAANGKRSVAECYALGLDPTLATNDFRIVSFEMVDGKTKVEWEPKTNRWTGAEIQAVLKGAESLDGEWHEVDKASESDKAKYRFFKVVVELP